MSARWLKRDESKEGGHSQGIEGLRRLDTLYTSALRWALGHRGWWRSVRSLIFAASVPLFMVMNKTFIPNDDRSEFEISIRAPEGTSMEQTRAAAQPHRDARADAARGRLHAW